MKCKWFSCSIYFSLQKPQISGISRRPLTVFVYGVGTKANIYLFLFFAVLRQRNYGSRHRWKGLSGCMTITVKMNTKGMLSGLPDAFRTASGDVRWRHVMLSRTVVCFENGKNDGSLANMALQWHLFLKEFELLHHPIHCQVIVYSFWKTSRSWYIQYLSKFRGLNIFVT